jgi:glyoxylase-like metal-dependent hydrolase (beta-lactamase superfamily II)
VWCVGPWGRTLTNCYLVRTGTSWVLVDAGWSGDDDRIVRAAEQVFGDDAAPAAILLTHVHPDHSGAAQVLAQRWDCPVHLHPEEEPVACGDFESMVRLAGPLDRWVR